MNRLFTAIAVFLVCPYALAQTGIDLLKHPWPYQASVTVSSDRHWTPPEVADAVHTLVMSEDEIGADSPVREWVLGDGVGASIERGFGLPLADSFWLVGDQYAVFRRGATRGAKLELNTGFAEHIDSLFRQGRVDTLHTFGTGDISREQAAQAMGWLAEQPHRRLRVWVSHSFSETPSGSEPGVAFLSLATKNLVKGALRWVGGWSVVKALGDRFQIIGAMREKLLNVPKPYPYPRESRWTVTAFHIVLVCVALGGLGLIRGGWRRRASFTAKWVVLSALSIAVFWPVQLNYSTGDNPGSPRYNIDFVNDFGVDYYWFIMPRRGYQPLVLNRLALREQELAGRRTFFHKIALDNGQEVLAFARNSAGLFGMSSLELLTADRLELLREHQGVSVLYTHWFENLPGGAFSERALAGLGRLRDGWKSGEIWVAPSGKLLDFHFVRTFLDFEMLEESGTARVQINGVSNPIEGDQPVSRERLSGLSFASSDTLKKIQVWHNRQQLSLLAHERPGGGTVWQIP